MDKKWEIRKISTPERIFNKIKEEMAQPVGIVIFGADCDLKNEVLDTTMKEFQGFARYYTKAPDAANLARSIKKYPAIVVTLTSDESGIHSLRHELVKVMRNVGAETVVGIYAKCKKPAPLPGRGFLKSKTADLARQIVAIEQSNPTADGLDYFIVIEGEE